MKATFALSFVVAVQAFVAQAAPLGDISPITPMLPIQQTVRSQLGVMLISDEAMGARYVTTLDRAGGRVAKSWPQAIFGVERLSAQNKRLATWFTHKEQPEVTQLVSLQPAEVFRGVTDIRGAEIKQANGMQSPGAYVNGVFTDAAFNQLSSMGLSGQESLQLVEQLGEHGSRTLKTTVVKRASLTLRKVPGQQCRTDTVNGRQGRVCTVRYLEGSHEAVSAGDIQFTVQAVKAPEGVMYRVGPAWKALRETMALADFRGAQSIEVFYPSKSGPQADPTTVQRLEAVFFSTSRQRFGDKFVIPIGRKHAGSEVVNGRANILTVEDRPTNTTYITTLNRSREQSVFGSWPPRGPNQAAWYLNLYRAPTDDVTSVAQTTPPGMFEVFTLQGNKPAIPFSAQAAQQFQQSATGVQQLLTADALMVSGAKRKYQLNARKVGGITLLPALQRCQPAVVKGVQGQSCELRRIEVNAQTLKSNDIHFRLSARLPYAIQNQSRYQVGHSGWVELGNPVALDAFTQGGSIALFVPGDAVVALTSLRAVSGEFSSRSRGRMGDRATIPMMPKGSAPTAEVKEQLALTVLHDEVTQSRYLASTGRSYGAGLYGSLTDPAQPVIWQVSKDVSQAQPRNLRPVGITQGFANAQGQVQRGRMAPQDGFVNPVLTPKAAESLAKVGGSLALKMDVAQASGHSATFNINAITRSALTLRAPVSQVCTPVTIDGVDGMRCPLRELAPSKMLRQWGDLQFRLTAKLDYASQAKGRYLIDDKAYPLGKNVPLATLANAKTLALFVPSETTAFNKEKDRQRTLSPVAVTGEVTSRSIPALRWALPISTTPRGQSMSPDIRYLTVHDEVTRRQIVHVLGRDLPQITPQQLHELASSKLGDAHEMAVIVNKKVPNATHLIRMINVGTITLRDVRSAQASRSINIVREVSAQLPVDVDLSELKVCAEKKCEPFASSASGRAIVAPSTGAGIHVMSNLGVIDLSLRGWGARYSILSLQPEMYAHPATMTILLDGTVNSLTVESGMYSDAFHGNELLDYWLYPEDVKKLSRIGGTISDLAGIYKIKISSHDASDKDGYGNIKLFVDGVKVNVLPGDDFGTPFLLGPNNKAAKNYISNIRVPKKPVLGVYNYGTFDVDEDVSRFDHLWLLTDTGIRDYKLDGVRYYLNTSFIDTGAIKAGTHTIEFIPTQNTRALILLNHRTDGLMSYAYGFFDGTGTGHDLVLKSSSVAGVNSSFVRVISEGITETSQTVYYRVLGDFSDFVDMGRSTWSGSIEGRMESSGNVTIDPHSGISANLEVYPLSGKKGTLNIEFSLTSDFSESILERVMVGTTEPSQLTLKSSSVAGDYESRVEIRSEGTSDTSQTVYYRVLGDISDFVDERSTWSGSIEGRMELSGDVTIAPHSGISANLEVYPLDGKKGTLNMEFSLTSDFSDSILESVMVGKAEPSNFEVESVSFVPYLVTEKEDAKVTVTLTKDANIGDKVFIKPLSSMALANRFVESVDGVDKFLLINGGLPVEISKVGKTFSFIVSTLDAGLGDATEFIIQINAGERENTLTAQSGSLFINQMEWVSKVDSIEVYDKPVNQTIHLTTSDLIQGQSVLVLLTGEVAQGFDDVSLCFSSYNCEALDTSDPNLQSTHIPLDATELFLRWTPKLGQQRQLNFSAMVTTADASIPPGNVTLHPNGGVTRITADPALVTEGGVMDVTLALESMLPTQRSLWMSIKPTADLSHTIVKEDILLGAMTGGHVVSSGADGLSWKVLLDDSANEITFPLTAEVDGDVEKETFIISANPGETYSDEGRAESTELTIMPSPMPMLEFTSEPKPEQGVIGGKPLELIYGLSLQTSTPTPTSKGATKGVVAMHLLQRAALALKLQVTLSGIAPEQLSGQSYCTLTSNMGQVAVPLKLEQKEGNSQAINCADNVSLELTLPSSGKGWTTIGPNQYTTTLSAIATMNDPVSEETVDGKTWSGAAQATGRLTARVSME